MSATDRFWNFTASVPACTATCTRRFATASSPLWLTPASPPAQHGPPPPPPAPRPRALRARGLAVGVDPRLGDDEARLAVADAAVADQDRSHRRSSSQPSARMSASAIPKSRRESRFTYVAGSVKYGTIEPPSVEPISTVSRRTTATTPDER